MKNAGLFFNPKSFWKKKELAEQAYLKIKKIKKRAS